ncbi:hypothetical protein ACFQPF_00210 [Fictibacillus iocasae]|uniref:Uncharacterized protein n=1 Tax=Fictibacillus iocasae TaxID=2715437 RepID=A0ABW2NHD9_9BACL
MAIHMFRLILVGLFSLTALSLLSFQLVEIVQAAADMISGMLSNFKK